MKKFVFATAMTAATLGLAACDVDQTEEAELPEVDVEGGNMPEFDVETADVDVGTEEVTVDVPTVDVDMPDDAEGEPVTGSDLTNIGGHHNRYLRVMFFIINVQPGLPFSI